MSMNNGLDDTAPTADDAPVVDDVTPDTTEYKVHPSWEKALEAIPDMLRGPVIEQVRTSERESQSAIEKARAEATPAEWRALAADAADNGITVEELVSNYNSALSFREQLQADPDAFLASLSTEIDGLVASGQLTRKEAAAARKDLEATAEILSPDQERIRTMQAQLDQQEQRWADRDDQASSIQQAEAADAYVNEFFTAFDARMDANGLAGVNEDTKAAVARIADSILTADTSDTITSEQAIDEGIRQLVQSVTAMGGTLPVRQGAAPRIPVNGGSSAVAAPEAQHFAKGRAGEGDRMAAMMAAAKNVMAGGE